MNKGFSLSISALIMMLILISFAVSIQSMDNDIFIINLNDSRMKIQRSLIAELLLAEMKGIRDHLQNVSGLFINITKAHLPPPSGIITKIVNGTGGNPYKVTVMASEGAIIVITDSQYIVKAIEVIPFGRGFIDLMLPSEIISSGCLLIYDSLPIYTYLGNISPSLNYTVIRHPPSIISTSWSPPQGFNQILLHGAPPLSLIELAVNLQRVYAVMDLTSTLIAISGPFGSGSIHVRIPMSWYYGDIKSGDVYLYYP
ncbi:MAG: hypothetical protein NZ922_02505 [Candidatus Methanomethyliaceae archaeon]|nr:hypothetical protein [Candidatus Methanomethyliaceae archaeon]MDW7971559.1 hypothetical protein [Nitrososphaerota archaeon]